MNIGHFYDLAYFNCFHCLIRLSPNSDRNRVEKPPERTSRESRKAQFFIEFRGPQALKDRHQRHQAQDYVRRSFVQTKPPNQ